MVLRHHPVSGRSPPRLAPVREALLAVEGKRTDHRFDERSGRPLDAGHDAVETLSEGELEAELTIAAYAPGHLRWDRYQRLLDERKRRLIAA